MAGANQYKAKQFIDAIPGTGGIISLIAKKVGCDWYTAKKYVTQFPTIARAYEDECEAVTDLAEGKVIEAIRRNDGQMIRYYLSTKGKGRGYTERHEVTGKDGKELLPMAAAVAALQAADKRLADDDTDGD